MKYSDLGHAFNRNMNIMSIRECKWSDNLVVRWQLTDQANLIESWKIPFLCNCQIASFLNLRLFLYFTSLRGEFYIFHLYLVAFIFIIP